MEDKYLTILLGTGIITDIYCSNCKALMVTEWNLYGLSHHFRFALLADAPILT